jgi:sigma-54 dependent transcriptional regulator, acetoin dehydrogenase operon transcriptional activator AcoR
MDRSRSKAIVESLCEFTPIGATQPVVLDVAVVSATLHDLSQRVRAGQFGEDLFFRLSGVTVTLLALRHRGTG